MNNSKGNIIRDGSMTMEWIDDKGKKKAV